MIVGTYMNRLLYEDIAHKIEDQIQQGNFQDGEKLPSERELTSTYNVSRNVIREAIGSLREKGFVDVKPGKGAYVTKFNKGVFTETLKRMLRSDDSTGEDILEVREEMETAIIRKAVQKATTENVETLKKIYKKMQKHSRDVDQFIEEDAHFHMTLAESTQNRVFVMLMHSFFELTERSIFAVTRLTPYSIADAQHDHRSLIQAIETENEDLAVSTIEHHMNLLRNEVELLKGQRLL